MSWGHEIVVQGGTFLNDAVLRSFEREIGREVIRPGIAGLMGAYGAALYARSLGLEKSSTCPPRASPPSRTPPRQPPATGAATTATFIINTFAGGEKYISGNKCERGAGGKLPEGVDIVPDLHRYKREKDRGAGGIRPRRRTRHRSVCHWHWVCTSWHRCGSPSSPSLASG